MTILTAPARKSKSKAPRPFSCEFVSLTIAISDTRYSVDEIPAGEFGTRAFRLAKHSGDHQVYDVIRTHGGLIECDCPDYVMRHAEDGTPCKHSRALAELGLLPTPGGLGTVEARNTVTGTDGNTPLRDVTNGFPQPDLRQHVAADDAPDHVIKSETPSPLACCPAEAAEPCGSCVVPPQHIDPWDVECDPHGWPDETDADVWSIVDPEGDDDHLRNAAGGKIPSHQGILIDSDDRLTLHDLVARQVEAYRGWANAAGGMIADELESVLLKIKLTSAATPEEFRARSSRLDDSLRQAWEEIGRQSCACQHEPAGSAWGHEA